MGSKPWTDPDRLEHLYYDEGLDQHGIADRLGCGQATVSRHMRRHGIGPGKASGARAGAKARRVEYAEFTHTPQGYEQWRARYHGERDRVAVHRLAAVAWFGYDAVCGMDVHHKNNVPWDTRESNISLLSPSDHRRYTALNQVGRDEDGNFC